MSHPPHSSLNRSWRKWGPQMPPTLLPYHYKSWKIVNPLFLAAQEEVMHKALDSMVEVNLYTSRWLNRLSGQMISGEFEFEQDKDRPFLAGYPKASVPMYDEAVLIAMEMALIPYFEKKFLPNSHGWRPNHSLETCLYQIQTDNHQADWMWSASPEEGFGDLSWDLVMDTLSSHVYDPPYLNLVQRAHEIGYGMHRLYHPTNPEAQPVSMPLMRYLYNVVFHEFDLSMKRLAGRPQWSTLIDGKKISKFKYYRYANEILITFQGSKESNEKLQKLIKNKMRQTLGLTLKIYQPPQNDYHKDTVRFVTFDLKLVKGPDEQKSLQILIPIEELDMFIDRKWIKHICDLNPYRDPPSKPEPDMEDLMLPPMSASAKMVYRPHLVWESLWDHYSIASNAHVMESIWIHLKKLAYREIKPGKMRESTLLSKIYKPLKKKTLRGNFTEIIPLPKGGFKQRPCRPVAEENFPILIGLNYDIDLGPSRGFLPKKTPKKRREVNPIDIEGSWADLFWTLEPYPYS